MFHVLTGAIYLGYLTAHQPTRHEDVEIIGPHWHFVDLV